MAGDGRIAFHDPVMVEEVLEVLEGARSGTILDGTLGGGGHTEAMLTRWPGAGCWGWTGIRRRYRGAQGADWNHLQTGSAFWK